MIQTPWRPPAVAWSPDEGQSRRRCRPLKSSSKGESSHFLRINVTSHMCCSTSGSSPKLNLALKKATLPRLVLFSICSSGKGIGRIWIEWRRQYMSVHNLSENLIDRFCCRHRILCTFQGCCVVVPPQAGQHNLVFLWQTFSSMHQFGKSWKTTFFPFSLNLYFRVPGSSVNALIGLVCPRKCLFYYFIGGC